MNQVINKEVYWKLRIPLILFILGTTAGLYQSFPGLFLFENSFFVSIQYIGVNALLIWFLEVTEKNEKRVHFAIGILVIVAAFFIDFLLV